MNKLKIKIIEGISPALIGFVLMGICIVPFKIARDSNTNFIEGMQPIMVAGEENNPIYGRLLFAILVLIWLVIGFCIVCRIYKKAKAPTIPMFCLCFIIGVNLWQLLGETMWHFTFRVEDEYLAFVRLESMQAIPLVIVFTVFLVNAIHKRKYGDGLLLILSVFWANWIGHIICIGTLPFVYPMDKDGWYPIAAIIGAIPACAIALSVIFRDSIRGKEITKRERLYASILLFAALGCLFFIFVLKE